MTERPSRRVLWVLGLSLACIALYGIGWAFPDAWWGTHFLAFMRPGFAVMILIGSAFWAISAARGRLFSVDWLKGPAWMWGLILGVGMGVGSHSFPMTGDVYGDSAKFHTDMREAMDPNGRFAETDPVPVALSLNIWHPKTGERTVLNAVRWMAGSGGDYRPPLRLWNALWGALYGFAWGFFLFQILPAGPERLVMVATGILAPWILFFGEHLEVYAPTMALATGFAGALVMGFREAGRRYHWVMLGLWLLMLKFHITAWMLAPVVGLVFLHPYLENRLEAGFSGKWVATRILLPLVLVGLGAYFFVFGDHNDPRFLDGITDYSDRVFLPLLAPEAPLDRYTLLHPNHFFDFLNLAFLWSGGSILTLLGSIIVFRKQVPWNDPGLVLVGLALVLYGSFLFVLNPLLSMPIDWDLMALPAPFLLVYALVLMDKIPLGHAKLTLLGGVMGLAILGASIFGVHFDRNKLGQRLERTGVHTFRTYWIRSVGTMKAGWQIARLSPEEVRGRLEQVIEELEADAVLGNDEEYGNLLQNLARNYRTETDQLDEALRLHQLADTYMPDWPLNQIGWMEAHFLRGEYRDAYALSQRLVVHKHPSPSRARLIALNCALEAELWQEAQKQAAAYLNLVPDDSDIRQLYQQLQRGDDRESAKAFFQQ